MGSYCPILKKIILQLMSNYGVLGTFPYYFLSLNNFMKEVGLAYLRDFQYFAQDRSEFGLFA